MERKGLFLEAILSTPKVLIDPAARHLFAPRPLIQKKALGKVELASKARIQYCANPLKPINSTRPNDRAAVQGRWLDVTRKSKFQGD